MKELIAISGETLGKAAEQVKDIVGKRTQLFVQARKAIG
jgi:hypothetical protein